ncbi:bifunctional precorrin-2 dehydrogenase/sirohydrochlorin ferrochelatase [Desulfothermus naphthae]
MHYYPVFLDLKNKECLVVGAGSVGKRKIEILCKAAPKKILVVDPYVSNDFQKSLPKFVEVKNREFQEKDLDNKFLVIVATNNLELNKRISKLCHDRNILCNVVDRPNLCSFIVPSIVDKDVIEIAISTGGKSPAMSRYLKKIIENAIGDELVTLTKILGKMRPIIISQNKMSDENKKIFNSFIEDRFILAIKNKDLDYIKERIKSVLKEQNEEKVMELLNGIF